jgi:hypothetical protein
MLLSMLHIVLPLTYTHAIEHNIRAVKRRLYSFTGHTNFLNSIVIASMDLHAAGYFSLSLSHSPFPHLLILIISQQRERGIIRVHVGHRFGAMACIFYVLGISIRGVRWNT